MHCFIFHITYVICCFLSVITYVCAAGAVPEVPVVIVEEKDGEGAINIRNTDNYPVLLLTTLQNAINKNRDIETMLSIAPPVARIEPGKIQRVRFILTNKDPLKTEHMERVIFESIPPQKRYQSTVHMVLRQNVPVIIRPSGLITDEAPWKHLIWSFNGQILTVNNPSPYVVRLGQDVVTFPDQIYWVLPQSYILPEQTLVLIYKEDKILSKIVVNQIRFFPTTTWGFSVENYDVSLVS
ncbi:fimbria/pilus chaperone family protein [Candidatus Curculioniphilus buchneri]|uniref:fimbria/pilus chaperone family protein n=1 Tax=Candidatus Curculioniphilus buchneri TaxID=690594 RepID=UPI00376F062E